MNLTHLVCLKLTRLTFRGYLRIPLKTFFTNQFLFLNRLALPPCGFAVTPSASLSSGLGFRLLIHLGVLHPITRDVQLNNHAVVHQSVDGRRRHHGVFENCFPF